MSRILISNCSSSRNSSSLRRSCSYFLGKSRVMQQQQFQQDMLLQENHHQSGQRISKRWGHSVRLIALEDLPHGKAYRGDVLKVKAGYARNHLIPQKLALYATPQNFEKLGMVDPDFETEEERIARLQRESNMTATEDKYLKDADLLKKYLKNKVLQMWRTVDPNSTDTLHPGVVTADNIRLKLSKQLKIDLDDKESIHVFHNTAAATSSDGTGGAAKASTNTTNPLNFAELDDVKIQTMADELVPVADASGKCSIEINRLGEYLAVIGLRGGYAVPLRVLVRQRAQ